MFLYELYIRSELTHRSLKAGCGNVCDNDYNILD